ncbi:MAG: C-GCAxxG-C-C family protein [Clostridia bacterium]
MQEFDPKQKAEKARELFLSGCNCAQSVFTAYAEEMGLEESFALKLSGGMGGGMGGLRETCGAVSGMVMAFSALRGYNDAADTVGKKQLYAQIQGMAAHFTDDFETLNCRELLKLNDIVAASTPAERTPEYYRTRPCVRYVEACAALLAQELNR